MITIKGKIYPGIFIGSKEVGEQFFAILEKYGFSPDKISFHEPVREEYCMHRAIEMWSDFSKFDSHIAGGMLAKKKKPNYSFMTSWAKGEAMIVTPINFYIAKTSYNTHKETFEKMYREIFNLVEGIYAYITHEVAERRQHVAGTLETRMPGVFYCNYFGQLYVDFFGKDTILSGPWTKTEVLDSSTIVTYLSDDPNDLVESNELEMKAQHHLGIDSFGDREWEKEHIWERQIKNVPKLHLPTIHVPIDQ